MNIYHIHCKRLYTAVGKSCETICHIMQQLSQPTSTSSLYLISYFIFNLIVNLIFNLIFNFMLLESLVKQSVTSCSSSWDEMFHNLANKILISVQKQSQSLRMRRSVVCSIAFFLLAIISGKATWSREIPTWSKVEEIERELDKVFHQHLHYLKRTLRLKTGFDLRFTNIIKNWGLFGDLILYIHQRPVFIWGDRKEETSCCCSPCLSWLCWWALKKKLSMNFW